MRLHLLLCAFTGHILLHPLIGRAQAINIDIQQPTPNQIVANQLYVQVAVQSTYLLQSVSATVDGRTSNLISLAGGSTWTNTLSLLGTTRGQKTLTINATDVFGSMAQTQTVILKDLPPTLSVIDPRVGTVARPQVQLTASATDDDPVGAVITVYAGTNVLATGTNSISTVANIAGNDGQGLTLQFSAMDSAGQTSNLWQTIYVFTNTSWVEVASVGGPILDVSTNNILFVDGHALTTKSRVTLAEAVLLNDPSITPLNGALTPQGAMFRDSENGNMYEVRNGTVTNFGFGSGPGVQGNYAPGVQGNYAVWSDLHTALIRRDLSAGTNAVVSSTSGAFALAPSGDVVYVMDPIKYQTEGVYLYRDGTNSQVSFGSYFFRYEGVDTDGNTIIYTKVPYPWAPPRYMYTIISDGTTETVIATNTTGFSTFAINHGWLAFLQDGALGVAQVWTRSPGGVSAQQTLFATPSTILALAPNGDLIVANAGRLYRPRQGSAPLDLGAWSFGTGQIFWQQGRFYAQLGRSLFALARPLTITPAGFLPNGQFQIIVQGNAGDTVIAQASTNLVDWVSFSTNFLTTGVIQLADPFSVGARTRFYRAYVPHP